MTVDLTADVLVSRAAGALESRADELIAEVERCLRRDVPELWEHSDAMTWENVAGHVIAVRSGLTRGAGPDAIEGPGGLPFEAAEFALAEGSLLALYTDGLLEARGQDAAEGVEDGAAAAPLAPE